MVQLGELESNEAHTRQSRPDSGLGFQVNVLKTFLRVPSSLGRLPDSSVVQLDELVLLGRGWCHSSVASVHFRA